MTTDPHEIVQAFRADGHELRLIPSVDGVAIIPGGPIDLELRRHLRANEQAVSDYLTAELVVAEAVDDLALADLDQVRGHRAARPLVHLDDAGDIDTAAEWPDDLGDLES